MLEKICECGDSYEDEHGHGLCFGCKISTLRWKKVPESTSHVGKEIVELAEKQGRGIVRASPLDKDIRDSPTRPALSDETKRLIHATHGR